MRKPDTSTRTKEAEILDDFELKGNALEKTLQDLQKVNKWLGGNKITLDALKKLLAEKPKEGNIQIADVGCGNGAMLREIARWGRPKNKSLCLTGIDANPDAIRIARNLSADYPEIDYKVQDVFSEEFKRQNFDVILCTLTLHHFKDHEIRQLLLQFYKMSTFGIIINDLHRSKVAYRLFQAFCAVFIHNRIAREDGLVSILRGFKKRELEKFSEGIPNSRSLINWKWAFRYQWIIQK